MNGKKTRVPRAVAQDIILNAAEELFYREGIHNVSVDAVVERAGINKMSVYRQFSSKADLVLAYLERKQQAFWEEWEAIVHSHPASPRDQILCFFANVAAKASESGFRGCCFINLAVEFPDPEHPVRQLVRAHQKQMLDKFQELATALGAESPLALAHTLVLLMEGAYVDSQTIGTNSPAIPMLPSLVEKLLDSVMGPASFPGTWTE
jgi:AcrR family transcriptional regulator